MRITSLVENTSVSGEIGAEHGLSLYIETGDLKILFDMGQTELFAENALKLGIDLSAVDFAVISHGHYDHGGGLARFLEINSKAPIYVNRYAFEPHYNGTDKYIGLNTALWENKRLIYTTDKFEIRPGITIYSCNGRPKYYELGSFGLNMVSEGEKVPDDFRHEQYLLIEENDKRILFSGCSHKGILNIAEWFVPDVLVGGFHFSKIPTDETLQEYAEILDRIHTDYYTCHCTGVEQFAFMKAHMNRLSYLSAGQTIII